MEIAVRKPLMVKRRPKRLRRRKGNQSVRTSLSMAGLGFPLRLETWLPATSNINATLVTANNYVYNANSIYKYDGVNVVANFNALSGIYKYFLVDKVRAELTIQNLSPAMGITTVLYTSTDAASIAPTQAADQRGAVQFFTAPSSGSPSVLTRRQDIDLKKYYGLQSLSTSDAAYCGGYNPVAAVPTIPLYWIVSLTSSDTISNITYVLTVRLFYHVVSFEQVLAL